MIKIGQQIPKRSSAHAHSAISWARRNAVALLALFVALGGTSYAAVNLPSNSVGAKQLRKQAVTAKKIKRNAVTGTKVKDRSLLATDFKAGQLPAGAKGAKGDPGATGNTGRPGGPGLSGHEVVLVAGVLQPTDAGDLLFTAECPTGKKVLGGGVTVFNDNIRVMSSAPVGGALWSVRVRPFSGATFGGGGPSAVNIRIVCATVAEPAP
jgi:hypothetical protein